MKELWRGKVPVQFVLANDSLAGMDFDRPTGFYKLVPRVSYLSFCVTELREHFKHCTVTPHGGECDVWLSRTVNGQTVPIHWHYPLGVIFDAIVLAEKKQAIEMLPLCLSVHFSSIPEKQGAIALPEEAETSSVLSHHLKESHALRYGTTSAVTNLPIAQFRDLVSSVRECNHSQFSGVRAQLKRREESSSARLAVMLHHNNSVWLRSAPSASTTEESLTLKEFLAQALPPSIVVSYGETTPSHTDPNAEPTEKPEEGDKKEGEEGKEEGKEEVAGGAVAAKPNARFLIQGVVPSPETPLVWLTEYMAHPDGFLHIVVSTDSRDEEKVAK